MNSNKIVDQLVSVMNERTWTSYRRITQDLNLPTYELLPVLLYGRDKLFIYGGSGRWRLRKKIKADTVNDFRINIANGERASEKAVRKYRLGYPVGKNRRSTRKSDKDFSKGSNAVKHGEGEDYSSLANKTKEVGHPFSYGKRKDFKGSDGQYWENPDFKKPKESGRD